MIGIIANYVMISKMNDFDIDDDHDDDDLTILSYLSPLYNIVLAILPLQQIRSFRQGC